MAKNAPTKLQPVPFAVDAALLRELGERLVGRPEIALAELIKNAYDADASVVELEVREDRLVVADDGHGMTPTEFRDRWMRIGSPHKERERTSRKLDRPLTGSKGIGRLAVQFLGHELELWTQGEAKSSAQRYARINWDAARRRQLITQATALVGTVPKSRRRAFPRESRHGTIIEVERLNQQWGEEELQALARQVWALQPPFSPTDGGFEIKLKAAEEGAVKGFESQVTAYLDVWYARIKGELATPTGEATGILNAELAFFDGERHVIRHEFPGCAVTHAAIEIRLYYLQYRQPRGLSVGDLRKYFNQWGGVHVYDAGFRLPYYGPDQDWLGIEMDHSHRLSRGSNLLPDAERVRDGLRYLPTNSRLFGQVRVSTAEERRRRGDLPPEQILQIQASRDRLVDNQAYEDLRNAVRLTLDWYANREAARAVRRQEESGEALRVASAAEELGEIVESLESKLPKRDFAALSAAVEQVQVAEHSESAERERQTRLLATLASAGASTLAYEHEVGKQLGQLRSIARQLQQRAKADPELRDLTKKLQAWVKRAQQARGLFSSLLDEEEREQPRALPARTAIRRIVDDLEFVLGGVPVEIDIDSDLRLPKARLAEWTAIFQNALTNAVAAMQQTRRPRILIRSSTAGRRRAIRVEDTGVGIDLDDAERLFEPFERGDPERIGSGSGLGLAIIRMLAEAIGVRVAFVKPDEGWSTSLRISWTVTSR